MELGARPDVSVVVVGYNTCSLLEQCLRSLEENATGVAVETFVVDNASADDSNEMVRRTFPRVTLIENRENVGFARANNQAMAMARGRYILLLNPDTIVLPGALEETVAFMDRRTRAGIATCKVLNPDYSFQACYGDSFPSLWTIVTGGSSLSAAVSSLFLGKRYLASAGHGEEEISTAHPVTWVMGAFMMIRRDVYDQIGGLDENLFMYGEETDYCYRARRAGWKMAYTPAGSIIHLGGQSTKKIDQARVVDYLMTTSFYFYRKHRGSLYACFCYAVAFVTSAFKFAMYGLLAMLPTDSLRKGRRREKLTQMRYTLHWCVTQGWRTLGRNMPA